MLKVNSEVAESKEYDKNDRVVLPLLNDKTGDPHTLREGPE